MFDLKKTVQLAWNLVGFSEPFFWGVEFWRFLGCFVSFQKLENCLFLLIWWVFHGLIVNLWWYLSSSIQKKHHQQVQYIYHSNENVYSLMIPQASYFTCRTCPSQHRFNLLEPVGAIWEPGNSLACACGTTGRPKDKGQLGHLQLKRLNSSVNSFWRFDTSFV